MATKLTRAEKRARNKARWAQGERWTPTPEGSHPSANGSRQRYGPTNGNGGSNGNGNHGISRGTNSADATPGKRSNKWRKRAAGVSNPGSAPELVYAVSRAGQGAAPAYSARARLLAAAQADTPGEARALATPFAPPCRCGRALPERCGGYLWLGYRFVACVKCGHDVLSR